MAERRPLVLDRDTSRIRELRRNEEAIIPLEQRFQRLQAQFRMLLFWMIDNGFELPSDLAEEADLKENDYDY